MQEERRLILKMVEEKKITAEEAAALLDAMNDLDEEDKPEEESWEKLDRYGEEFAHKVEHAAERFSRSLQQKLEGGLGDTFSRIGKVLNRIPFVAGEERYEFVDEYRGEFAEGLDVIPVQLRTTNGYVQLEGWDQSHYRVEVLQKVRGQDRESAKRRCVDVALGDNAEGASELLLDLPHSSHSSVSCRVSVPNRNRYAITAETVNGAIRAKGLQIQDLTAQSSNGKIDLSNLQGERITAGTSNGAIHLEDVSASQIRQRSGNGSIVTRAAAPVIEAVTTNGAVSVMPATVRFAQGSIALETTNGSVRCQLPDEEDVGVAVEMDTGVGKAKTRLKGFELNAQSKRQVSRQLSGQTRDFDTKPYKLHIRARSGVGTIELGGPGDDS